MRKKFLAVALIFAIAAALCPASLAAQPIKLTTPTELEWGVEYFSTDGEKELIPGHFGWQINGEYQGKLNLAIYEEGSGLVWEEVLEGAVPPYFSSERSLIDFLDLSENGITESGTYYFTIQNLAVEAGYTDSDVATSPKWTYVKPSAKLAAPSAPTWSGFPSFTWVTGESDAKVCGGRPYIYYSKTQDGAMQCLGYFTRQPPDRGKIFDGLLKGSGYYRIRVKNLSADITKWQDSDLSELSEPYYYQAPSAPEPVAQGQLGDTGELQWTYRSDGVFAITNGTIPQDHMVLVVCLDESGTFTDVKLLSADQLNVSIGQPDHFKLIWLGSSLAPQCEAAEVILTP